MNKKDLVILFGIMFVNFAAAITVLPFLPLFALTYPGVDSGQAGLFLAVVSAALTAGTIGGGWLAEKFQRRKLLIQISSGMGLIAFLLIGYTTQIWQLTLLASIAWFAIGMATNMVRIVAGILADESERGRIFGIIGAATPLAALLAGIIGGRIVDRWDIPTLFTIMSFVFVLEFVIVLFVEDVKVAQSDTEKSGEKTQFQAGLPFWFLVIATLVAFVALSEIIMGRPLLMDELGFDATAISGVFIAGGLVSLPMTFLIGWLSDKFGRKNLLILCYILAIPGMAILAFSEPLWHFWASEILLAFVGIANVVGFALVTDLVPQESLDTAMSYYGASAWIGTIIGFVFVGYVIDWLGLSIMFGTAAVVMAIGLLLILPISQAKKKNLPTISA